MDSVEHVDLQTEAPPVKRIRILETIPNNLQSEISPQDMDDMADIYGAEVNAPVEIPLITSNIESNGSMALEQAGQPIVNIPGLGRLGSHSLSEVNQPDQCSTEPGPNVNDLRSDSAGDLPDHQIEAPSRTSATEPAKEVDSRARAEPVAGDSTEYPSVTTALEMMLGGIGPAAEHAETPLRDIQADKTSLGEDKGMDSDMVNGRAYGTSISCVSPVVQGEIVNAVANAHGIDPGTEAAMLDSNTDEVNQQEAEFELDSSPIESSSDDSDSDSSSSEDSDGEDGYKLLGPEEQARILMEGDGGSDDEGGGGKGGKGSAQLRTKNEVPEEVIPKPDVTITPDMKIEELGAVEAVVENVLLVKAKTSGEYKVLESGSVLCLEDRSVIGVVSETLGRVQQPLYSVRFTNAGEIADAGLVVGRKIFYSAQHSTYVFTQSLKAYKGSDASNLHDEEVGDEEIEFSDDEAEAEHKRRVKQKKLERRGGRLQQHGGSSRGGHPLQQEHTPYDPAVGISYDEAEDDGPYKPLTRPVGFADGSARREPPQEGMGASGRNHRGGPDETSHQQGGRGRGWVDRGRGRGDRGRGNDRGRGRGGPQDIRGGGYSQPPQDPRRNNYSQPPPQDPRRNGYNHPSGESPGAGYPPNNYNYQSMSPTQYSPQQAHFPPAFSQAPYQQQPYAPQQAYQAPYQNQTFGGVVPPQAGWANVQSPSGLPAGAYINPAFFGNQQQPPTAAGPQQWGAQTVQRSPEAERALEILKSLSGGRGGG